MRRRDRKHCPHVDVVGIYGDEINHTPGGRRNRCRDCGQLLDGPVSIAVGRQAALAVPAPTDEEGTAP